MPTLRTELGKIGKHVVQLENPTGKEIKAHYSISNQQNFEILPEKVVLKPYVTTNVAI
jgi:hypothetical protein